MSNAPKTLIASLHYAIAPAFCFADLAAAIDDALYDTGPVTWQVTGDDSRAIFDIDGTRLVLVIEDHSLQPSDVRPLTHGAVVTVVLAIGPAPWYRAKTSLADHRFALLSALTESIHRMSPAVHCLWSELAGAFDPDDYAPLIGLSAYAYANDYADPDDEWPSADAPPTPPGLLQQLDQLTDRFRTIDLPCDTAKADLPARTDHVLPSRAFIARTRSEFANSLPDLPKPNLRTMREIRTALYSDVPMASLFVTKAPLPQRLTIYTMNTTLMLVSLPVGSALLVHNLVRGEDMNFTARAIALSGTIIGLGQLLLSGSLTPFA